MVYGKPRTCAADLRRERRSVTCRPGAVHEQKTAFDCGPGDLRRADGTSFRGRSRRDRSAPARRSRARAGSGSGRPAYLARAFPRRGENRHTRRHGLARRIRPLPQPQGMPVLAARAEAPLPRARGIQDLFADQVTINSRLWGYAKIFSGLQPKSAAVDRSLVSGVALGVTL